MNSRQQFPRVMIGAGPGPDSGPLATILTRLFLLFVLSLTLIAQAQTYTVIHNFTRGEDGGEPYAGLTMDAIGNLYGTAYLGGYHGGVCDAGGNVGCGTVFKLSKHASSWVFSSLYNFQGLTDGSSPGAGVVIGPYGILYGTTEYGGGEDCAGFGCGTIFKLSPPPTACLTAKCNWADTVLHGFTGGADGDDPHGSIIFDRAGNIYGTTYSGGGTGCAYGCGTIYKLTPSGAGWIESILYSFTGGSDGAGPNSALIFDQAGNLYGTTVTAGVYGYGTVFQLAPSGGGWVKTILHSFQDGSDGAQPAGDLIFDQSGNLYGTSSGGPSSNGTVFMLSPSIGGWNFTVLYTFTGPPDGGPMAGVVFDPAGNLYGTTVMGGVCTRGSVFKLTPGEDGWTFASLHDFCGSDGGYPFGGVILDREGNLYGTTNLGGAYGWDGYGVVWQITP